MAGTFFIMIACLTWALDTLIRYPLLGAGYSAVQIVFIEHLTLIICVSPLLWRYRNTYLNMNKASLACLFFIGGMGSAIGTLAFTAAFTFLNPTIVILLQKLQPLVAILLAYYFLRERIESHFVFWALIILFGSFVMMWPDLSALNNSPWHFTDSSGDIVKGYGYALIAVFSWGAATVCGKYLSSQGVHENAILSGRFLSGFLVLLPIFLIMTPTFTQVSTNDIGMIIAMALLSGLIGMWFYYRGLNLVRAQTATLVELSFPVFAATINWVFLDMRLSMFQIVGACLLIVGNIGLRMKELRSVEVATQ